MAFSLEDKAHARELFVEEQLNLDDVAEETGVSLQTLKSWSAEGQWVAARKEFETDYLELTTNLHKLKVETVKNALKTRHSQDIIAATNLLKAMPVGRKNRPQVDKAALFLEFIKNFVEYLKERDSEALRYLEPNIQGFAESLKEA